MTSSAVTDVVLKENITYDQVLSEIAAPRIMKVGRIIRACRLDEMPKFN